jgi:hypothetical protein
VADAFARYRESLPDERRVLLDRYQRKDLAIKVVGVGSVGTFCAVVLMMADVDDPCSSRLRRPAETRDARRKLDADAGETGQLRRSGRSLCFTGQHKGSCLVPLDGRTWQSYKQNLEANIARIAFVPYIWAPTANRRHDGARRRRVSCRDYRGSVPRSGG